MPRGGCSSSKTWMPSAEPPPTHTHTHTHHHHHIHTHTHTHTHIRTHTPSLYTVILIFFCPFSCRASHSFFFSFLQQTSARESKGWRLNHGGRPLPVSTTAKRSRPTPLPISKKGRRKRKCAGLTRRRVQEERRRCVAKRTECGDTEAWAEGCNKRLKTTPPAPPAPAASTRRARSSARPSAPSAAPPRPGPRVVRGWSSHHFLCGNFGIKKRWGKMAKIRLSQNFC